MISVNDFDIQQGHFPDGTLAVNMKYVCGQAGSHVIRWTYENDAELFTLICIKRYLDEKDRVPEVTLIMDYIPHARMDRVQEQGDVFTLKYFCEIINSLGFERVQVLDPHSNVSIALLNNVVVESAEEYIDHALRVSDAKAVFFPDAGAMKRYAGMISGRPMAYGVKDRDWETGKILGYTLINGENIKNKDVLICDDICSRGGTFYYAAQALKAAGANKIFLYVTHLEHSVLGGEMIKSGLIDAIYTTTSIAATWDVEDSPIPIYFV